MDGAGGNHAQATQIINMKDIVGKKQFKPGEVLITDKVQNLIDEGLLLDLYIDRHLRGDRGALDEEDKQANRRAIVGGDRIISSYRTAGGDFWIITEADRSSTTVLTPDEY